MEGKKSDVKSSSYFDKFCKAVVPYVKFCHLFVKFSRAIQQMEITKHNNWFIINNIC